MLHLSPNANQRSARALLAACSPAADGLGTYDDWRPNDTELRTPLLSASPGGVDFGAVVLTADPRLANIQITNTSNEAASLQEIGLTGGGFFLEGAAAAPDTLASGATFAVTVGFEPALDGRFNGSLSLPHRNAAGEDRLTSVTLAGTGGPGDLEYPRDDIDFGSLPPGCSATRNLVIQNTSAGEISLSELSWSADLGLQVSLSEDEPVTLASDGVLVVTITFAPLSEGSASATLSIPDGGIFGTQVLVVGEGDASADPC